MIIGIVGAGPRGLSMVERLIRNNRENQHIQICLFDPEGPGGRVWRLDQPTELLMNSVSQQVTLFTDETLTSGGEISPGPNLYQWSQTEAKKYIEKQQFVNKEFFWQKPSAYVPMNQLPDVFMACTNSGFMNN